MDFWHWYRPYNEKSARAMERERSATENFDSLRQGLEHTMFQYKIRTLGLGVLDPGSVLHDCPEVVMDKILAYAKPKGYDEYDPSQVTINPIGFPRPKASANIQVPTVVKRDIKTFFQPGEKHVFPLLLPSEHLTGPCWRDFSRYVRSFPNWTPVRKAATAEEKDVYLTYHRKGSVYFVKVVYVVPGATDKKKAKKKKKIAPSGDMSSAKKARVDS